VILRALPMTSACAATHVRCGRHVFGELDVSVTLERDERCSLLRLEGVVGVSEASELKALLLESLGREMEVRIDPAAATYLDVTAVQLLWAAERDAQKTGRTLHWASAFPEAVSAVLGEAGLELGLGNRQAAACGNEREGELDKA